MKNLILTTAALISAFFTYAQPESFSQLQGRASVVEINSNNIDVVITHPDKEITINNLPERTPYGPPNNIELNKAVQGWLDGLNNNLVKLCNMGAELEPNNPFWLLAQLYKTYCGIKYQLDGFKGITCEKSKNKPGYLCICETLITINGDNVRVREMNDMLSFFNMYASSQIRFFWLFKSNDNTWFCLEESQSR